MMSSIRLLSLALLAGTALCIPFSNKLESHSLERRDNCTQYTSTSAGSVCIHRPSDCTATYLVQADDTCTSIGAKYNNFTLSAFYYWNPDVGQTCFGLRAYVPVCINTPWYIFTPPVQAPASTVEPASQLPVPIMPSIVSNCTAFELAGDGNTVTSIVQQNNITQEQFLNWNTYIDKTNPVAWAGYWVCVKA